MNNVSSLLTFFIHCTSIILSRKTMIETFTLQHSPFPTRKVKLAVFTVASWTYALSWLLDDNRSLVKATDRYSCGGLLCFGVCKCAFNSTLTLHTFKMFSEEMFSEEVWLCVKEREREEIQERLWIHELNIWNTTKCLNECQREKVN